MVLSVLPTTVDWQWLPGGVGLRRKGTYSKTWMQREEWKTNELLTLTKLPSRSEPSCLHLGREK